jgi:amino acid adenylation domain-containing protein
MKRTDSEGQTIRATVDRLAEEHGGNCFLIDPRRDEAVSFAECHSAVLGLALHLQNLGAGKGDKVACVMNNGRSAVDFLLGTLFGGQVGVPLNGAAGAAWLAAVLEHSEARILVTDDAHRREVDDVIRSLARPPAVIRMEDIRPVHERDPRDALPPLRPQDDGLLVYTSGSTGRPKGVLVSHRNLVLGGWNTVEAHRLTSDDRSLCVLPFYHMNAQVVTLMSTLLSGGSLVVPERFQVHEFWQLIDRFRCTWFALAPTIVSQLVQNAPEGELGGRRVPESVRFARCSSAPLSPGLHQRFEELFDVPLIEAMGSTEAGGAIFSNPLPPARRKLGSPGRPVGFEVRVVDKTGSEVAVGQTGEILVRGPSVMKGYYKEPAATAEVLDRDGWLRTGDLGFCDADGYFTIAGRCKEIIIKGGENVAPREIDEALLAHPRVLEAAAVGIPDPNLGEEIIAYVILKAGEEFCEADLLNWCQSRLGSIKTPSSIIRVDSLPRGPTGKVLRNRLAERAQDLGLAQPSHPAAPRDEFQIERLVMDVWEQVLRRDGISAQDNFFELGGHSLLAMEILIRLHQRLGKGLTIGFFLEHPTPARQAAAIAEELKHAGLAEALPATSGSPGKERTIPRRDRSGPCPLSPAQQRIWFVEQLHPGVPLYIESQAVRLRGRLEPKVIEAALNAIVARHEMLRTAIRIGADGIPVQFAESEVTLRLRTACCHGDEASLRHLLSEEARQPFDLAAAPLLRAALIETASDEHVLVVVMHHVVCDGYSLGVFFEELSAAYRKLVVGEVFAPPPLSIQYSDYAAWKCSENQQRCIEPELSFLRGRLHSMPRLVEWRLGFPRPAQNDYQGCRVPIRISPEISDRLRVLSRQEGVSLFTMVVAAFEVLLQRYCGKEKFLLGIPFANRERPELAPLIGCLVDILVLPADLARDRTFREHVREVGERIREMYGHRAVSFERLVQELGLERSLSHEPLVQVMLNWRTARLEKLDLPDLEFSPVPTHNGTSKFDLTVFLFDAPSGLEGEIEYSARLFDEDSMRRLSDHFETLLGGIVHQPGGRISRLPLLRLEERERVLMEWNRTATEYPRGSSIPQLFEEQVARNPEATAVVWESKSLSYRELNARANQLAGYLRHGAIGPGTCVGICMERSVEMLIGVMGILKVGAAYLPLDPSYPRERLRFMINDAQVPLVLCLEGGDAGMAENPVRLAYLDRDAPLMESYDPENPVGAATADSLAYVIYTSGSTGAPKGVAVPHRAVTRLVVNTNYVELGSEDRMAHVSNVCFDAATFEIWGALLNGGSVVVVPRAVALDPRQFALELERQRITTLFLTTALFNEMVSWDAKIFQGLKQVLVGGEAVNPRWMRRVLESGSPRRLLNVYGPTECTTFATFHEVRHVAPDAETIPIGRPVANTTAYVCDLHGNPVPPGIHGELFLGGDGLAQGYLNQPELTREKFVPNAFEPGAGSRLYRTGDLVKFLPDGSIEFIRRLDDQIKIRGFRIEPEEIEATLRRHPQMQEAVVVSRPGVGGEKRLVAYGVPQDGSQISVAQIREFLREKLPDYMVPSAVVLLKRLPLSPNGKIDQNALPAPVLDQECSGLVAPRGATEKAVAEVWSAVLGVQGFGVHDDFFHLGGHSLLATRAVSRLRDLLGVDIPLRLFFENATVATIAGYVDCARWTAAGPPLVPMLANHEEIVV